jgi:carbonic anhydrase
MSFPNQLLLQNVAWAHEAGRRDPALFDRLRQGQQPKVLWIGCADSRVPAEIVTGARPGDIFVHRNIANLFLPHDDNTMSVLEYALYVLRVSDVVVCGHNGCGGVRAALEPPGHNMPRVEHRIGVLRQLARRHGAELAAIACLENRADRLAELNVIEQARTLETLPLVRNALPRVCVHAWIFDVRNGLIRDLARAIDPSVDTGATGTSTADVTTMPLSQVSWPDAHGGAAGQHVDQRGAAGR